MNHNDWPNTSSDDLIDCIFGVADLLCLLGELDEGTPIKPGTVATAGKTIAHYTMRLSCHLDEIGNSSG